MLTKTHSGRRRERGQTIILVAISIVSLLAMAGLAIDVVTLYVARGEIQRAADAAAIAGAQAIADSGTTTLALTNVNFASAKTMAESMATARITAILPANLVAGVAPTFGAPTAINWARQGNPILTVSLQQANVPTFFAKIWGHRVTSVSATATAEIYNPSNNSPFTPIAPSAVKPWLVANADPVSAVPFVDVTTGLVEPNAVGNRFSLVADCPFLGAGVCPKKDNPLIARPPQETEYLAAQVTANTGNNICPSSCTGPTAFEQSVECADVTTQYSCGTNTANWDSTIVNGAGNTGPSAVGAECLIHAGGAGMDLGQDSLDPRSFPTEPPQILANSGPNSGTHVSTSSSIVTIPIFDSTKAVTLGGQITIVGFLQAFINQVQPASTLQVTAGDIDITVLNVSACAPSNNGNPAVVGGSGTSPVPVRLISPPGP